jgi:hypothetical protein
MDTQIVTVFCLVEDMLNAMPHREARQCEMSDAEVMTKAIMAVLYFGWNYVQIRRLLASQGYISKMLSRSRFSRRLHRIKPFFLTLFSLLGEHWKSLNEYSIYSIDTFPIPVSIIIASEEPKSIRERPIEATLPAKNDTSMGSSCI